MRSLECDAYPGFERAQQHISLGLERWHCVVMPAIELDRVVIRIDDWPVLPATPQHGRSR